MNFFFDSYQKDIKLLNPFVLTLNFFTEYTLFSRLLISVAEES